MAVWLKTANYRLNLSTVSSIKKSVSGSNVNLDLTEASGSIISVPMKNNSDADELTNQIIDTVNSGGDVNIDAAPFEKV